MSSLPILFIPERHWDCVPKNVLMGSLARLYEMGYRALCFEAPYNESAETIVSGVKSTIQFIESQFQAASPYLLNVGISPDSIFAMSYSKLESILKNYVSSKHSAAMALWFKELPGHRLKLALMQQALEIGFSIQGVDLCAKDLEPIREHGSQVNLGQKNRAITVLNAKRDKNFVAELHQNQQNGLSSIFLVGQLHFPGIKDNLEEQSLIAESIFFHPHSCESLDSDISDKFFYLEDTDDVSFRSFVVVNSETQEKSCEVLVDSIAKIKAQWYQEIRPTAATEALQSISGLPFRAYARPSLRVDCYADIEDDNQTKNKIETLSQQNIKGRYSFFAGKRCYCVPEVNLSPQRTHIQNSFRPQSR